MEQQEQRNGWNPEEDPRYRDIRGSVGGQGMYNPEEMQRQRLASSAMALGIAAIGSCLILPVFFPLVFASVAIVLAMISRGGESTLTDRARLAILLGVIAIVVHTAVMAIVLRQGFQILTDPAQYKQFDNIFRSTYGTSLEEYLQGGFL